MGPEYDFNVLICQCIVDYAKHQDQIMSVTNTFSVMHCWICLHTCAQFKDWVDEAYKLKLQYFTEMCLLLYNLGDVS